MILKIKEINVIHHKIFNKSIKHQRIGIVYTLKGMFTLIIRKPLQPLLRPLRPPMTLGFYTISLEEINSLKSYVRPLSKISK